MKNIVIIGGSSGIGKSLADRLVKDGVRVYASYYSNDMSGSDNGIAYFPLDVMDEAYDFSSLPEVVDGLVYCPGAIKLKPFSRIKESSFIDDFRLQVTGAIKTTQALLPQLKSAQSASIVYFSTVAVNQGFNFHTQVAVSKGAIEGLTRSLSAELAPRVRVNCIAPSLTNTPLAKNLLNTEDKINANAERHPLKRVGEAEDVAYMAAFLLSDEASWMTGQILRVDGGMSSIRG